jgi:hypothetical protein
MIQHPVPPEHLTQLGDITVSFALLESALKYIVWSLISNDQMIGQIITAEIPFKSIRALAISLYIHKKGKDNQGYIKLKELMSLASNIEERRNQIIHSVWGAGKDVNHITRIKTSAKESKGLQHNFEEISIEYLKKFSNEIKQVAENLNNFLFNPLA